MVLDIKKRIAHWRKKSIKFSNIARYLRRELKRVKERLNETKAENKELKKTVETLQQKTVASTRPKEEVIETALKLLIDGCVSYRAVSRVMKIFSAELGLKKAPCVQTIINWSTRLAMAKVRSAADYLSPRFVDGHLVNNFIFLIDCSICIGSHKIFLVLAIDRDHYFRNGAAPTLQDVHCVGIATAETWTGDNVADFLKKSWIRWARPRPLLRMPAGSFLEARIY